MDSVAEVRTCSLQEYLEFEEHAPCRHEFRGGRIYAMAGTKLAHNAVAGRLYARLLTHFAANGDRCQAFISDVRVHIERTGSFCYPDVVAVCGDMKLREGQTDTLLNPVLVAEVLSKSTEASDRGEKFADYQRIPTLQEYLLLRQDRVQLEIFRRGDPKWSYELVEDPQAIVSLESVGLQFRLEEIYAGVPLETAETGPRLFPPSDDAGAQ